MAVVFPPAEYVGIEYESADVFHRVLEGGLSSLWSNTHDGSVESDQRLSFGMPIDLNQSVMTRFNMGIHGANASDRTIGTEIVSSPIEFDKDLLAELKMLTSTLQDRGASGKSDRTGIHVHVSMPMSLSVVKNILILGAHLEDFFFKIAGMGTIYRGAVKNQSMYCRPITGVGPHHILSSGRAYQLCELADSLQSKSLSEFWERFAWLQYPQCVGGVGKYYPARYSWLNVYSLLLHNTLEFRVFNETLNPAYIFAVVELCVRFCENVLKNSFPAGKLINLPEQSIFSNLPKDDALATLDRIAPEFGLSATTVKTLQTLIKVNPIFSLPPTRIFTHCAMGRVSLYSSGKYPKIVVDRDEVETVVVDDIHARRGERS